MHVGSVSPDLQSVALSFFLPFRCWKGFPLIINSTNGGFRARQHSLECPFFLGTWGPPKRGTNSQKGAAGSSNPTGSCSVNFLGERFHFVPNTTSKTLLVLSIGWTTGARCLPHACPDAFGSARNADGSVPLAGTRQAAGQPEEQTHRWHRASRSKPTGPNPPYHTGQGTLSFLLGRVGWVGWRLGGRSIEPVGCVGLAFFAWSFF